MVKIPPVYFVSSNLHKYQEISKMVERYGIPLKWKNQSLIEPDFDDLEQVAQAKARQAWELMQKPVLVEDTGVYFQAYNNFPGTFAKRMYTALGYDGLLKLLEGKTRDAFFKTSICFMYKKFNRVFTGTLKGQILEEMQGISENVLPYERIFKVAKNDKVLCFMSREEKNEFSHRGQAARKFAEWYIEELRNPRYLKDFAK